MPLMKDIYRSRAVPEDVDTNSPLKYLVGYSFIKDLLENDKDGLGLIIHTEWDNMNEIVQIFEKIAEKY